MSNPDGVHLLSNGSISPPALAELHDVFVAVPPALSPGVTILYLKWEQKSIQILKVGKIWGDFGGLFVPKECKNMVLMRKLGLYASLRSAKIGF